MKRLIFILFLLAASTLLSGYTGFWEDSVVQMGQTTISNAAIGSDVHKILATHRTEAVKLNDFAESFNNIAYDQSRPQSERCEDLKTAAIEAIQQREKSFASGYEVKCSPDATAQAPELQMTIWPQVRFDYRFTITFKPTN